MVLQCINGVGSNPVEGRTKFENDIKYNNKNIDTLKIKQMLKIELKCNTALITKSSLLNKNIGKLLNDC
jgi:hypothetical protein